MQKTNHTAIGIFVLGAIFLSIFCILIFGSGHLLEANIFYTTSFDKSVNGLNVGAPVMFRGIKIGEVTDIQLSFDKMKHTASGNPTAVTWPINVTFKLITNSFAFSENRSNSWVEGLIKRLYPKASQEIMENWIREMVLEHGLRAQLQTQSYLTGQLFIELDLFQEEKNTPEIQRLISEHVVPTRMSAFERLYLSLNQNNFSSQVTQLYKMVDVIGDFFSKGKAESLLNKILSIADNLESTMQRLNLMISAMEGNDAQKFGDDTRNLITALTLSAQNLEALLAKFNHPRTDEILNNANSILSNANTVISRIKLFVSPDTPAGKVLPVAATSMFALLGSIDTSINKISTFIDTLQQQIPPVIANANDSISVIRNSTQPLSEIIGKLNGTMAKLDQAASDGSALLAEARKKLEPTSPLQMEITKAIQDARQAAQSIRSLTDMLNNQPEALLRGRKD
ncbi:MAG: MCE family protein [Victivallales bacterium]|nr:MCE family protein [Victivallales bacterium]